MTNKCQICAYQLILEVTRRCNACCEHCLRGEQESLDMQKELIDKVLDTVSEINEVTFTGGEPTLNLPVIEYFFEQAELRRKMPDAFYIVTNGLENQYELACLLLKYYPIMAEKDICGVAISQNRFHPFSLNDSAVRNNPLTCLSFYKEDKSHSDSAPDNWVIRVGKAEDNGIGEVQCSAASNFNFEILDDGTIYVETIYVSANGAVLPDCDMPYRDIDDEKRPSIDNFLSYLRGDIVNDHP